jgi:hypothetical protein
MSQSGVTQSLHALTATDIVQAIRHGHTTCEAVARACLDHIAVREPAVQAWQYLNAGCRSGSKTLLIPLTCRQNMVRPSTGAIDRPVMRRVWPCHAKLGVF